MNQNPRQFTSLDYADADMYGALLERPTTATPLNLPLQRLEPKETTGALSPGEIVHYKSEEARRQSLVREQNEAQAQRELALREREVARNLALQKLRMPDANPADVTTRDYEKNFKLPATDTKQPVPSPASPPPTPNGTAARASALVEPTATPAPAALKEAIATTAGNAISALPRALPQAAGRLVIPGVGAALSIGTRLVVGQSVTQAVTSTVAGSIGYGVGAIVGTAIAGPIGGVVGSMIGGTAATLFSDWLFAQNLPKGTAHLETFTPNYPPFLGGQTAGATYSMVLTYAVKRPDGTVNVYADDQRVVGPVGVPYAFANSSEGTGYKVDAHDYTGAPKTYIFARGGPIGSQPAGLQNISLTFLFGTPDNGTSIIQPTPPPDNTPYRYDTSPIGDDNTVPSGTPAAAASTNKGKDKQVAPSMPSNNTPNGAPFFPGHGGLAPSYLPNPEHQPSNLGGMMPQLQPLSQRQPLPFAEPEDIPVPRLAPKNGLTITPSSGGIVPIGYADVTPATVTQSTITVSEGTDALGNDVSTRDRSTFFTAVPSPVPTTAQPIPMSDALSPVPKSKSAPIVKTPTELANDGIKTALDQQQKEFNEKLGQLTAIATAIAALTPAIQGLPNAIANNPNVRAANRDDVQGAVCEIAQPGGCLGAPIKQAEDAAKANGNKLNDILTGLNTGGSAAQLTLLNVINNKLGDQVPGGISKFMENIAKNTYVEKALSVLTFAITLHNGLMLSNNLAQTLGGIINTVLGLILPKGLDGTPLNIGEVLGKAAHEIIADSIGEENYTKLTQEWAMANRIYQASTNVFNALTNAVSTLVNALEVIGSHVSKIGNALKKWGVLGQKAYEWFHPNPNFHNKYFTFLNNADTAANTIQTIVQIPVSIVDAKNQIDSANAEFKSAIKGDKNTDGTSKESGIATEENKDKKDEIELAKTSSQPFSFDFSDLFDGED